MRRETPIISRAVMAWAFRVNYRVAFVMRRDTTMMADIGRLYARELVGEAADATRVFSS